MNILAVFAHPDDEVLGAGGTLAKHAENGDRLAFAFGNKDCNDGVGAALEVLGFDGVWFQHWGYQDQHFERHSIAEAIHMLSYWGHQFDPDVIYTHHPADLNLDHSFTARAALTAFRPKPGEKPRTILACEVLSSTEYTFPAQFSANWFETLDGPHLDKKIAAMECYPSEVKSPRDGPGITTLASYRGNQCGAAYAEAFQLLRRGPC